MITDDEMIEQLEMHKSLFLDDSCKTFLDQMCKLLAEDEHSFFAIESSLGSKPRKLDMSCDSFYKSQMRVVESLAKGGKKHSMLCLHDEVTGFKPFELRDDQTGLVFEIFPARHLKQALLDREAKTA